MKLSANSSLELLLPEHRVNKVLATGVAIFSQLLENLAGA